MFEKYISNILVGALSQYAEDIDPTQLELKIFSGTASLNNLKLKPSALEGLGLPFKLSRAICKRINIDIPVRNLQSKPCVATIEELFITFKSPLDENANEEAFRMAERKAKEAVIAAYEAERKKRAIDTGNSESGMVSRLTEVIINNVVININSVHVRFERPSHGIIFGALLQEVSVKTTDASGKASFIDPHTSLNVHKTLDFKGLQLYAEPQTVTKGSVPNDPAKYLTQEQDIPRWQQGMVKRMKEGDKAKSTIFGPVNGRFIAEVMFQERIKQHTDRPYASVKVNLENFIAKLSREQYLTILEIASQATNASLMSAINHFRPSMPLSAIVTHKGPRGTNKAAQMWWRYAARAINEVGLYKRKRAVRSKLLMPIYCKWLLRSVVSDVISAHDGLMQVPQYKAAVLTPQQIAVRDGIFDRMIAADIVSCRHASQASIAKEVSVLRIKINDLNSEKAKKSSWFSWGKSSEEKDEAKMLDELEKEWGISGPEVKLDMKELPPEYEWLKLRISLGVGGVHLLLNDHDAVKMNLNTIAIGTTIYNAPGKDSASFTFTAEEWTVSNPDPKTRNEIPLLISQLKSLDATESFSSFASGSTSSFSLKGSPSSKDLSLTKKEKKFLSISGASKPIGSNVDFKFKMGLQPLQVVADPSFINKMGHFFVIPPSLDLTAISHTTRSYVSSAATQASEAAAAAVNEAKIIDADIDIRAPVAIIPQSTDMLDGPCLVVSLGRLRVVASPFSEDEKKDPNLSHQLHYYRNKADLTDLFVTCGSFRRALLDNTDGFPIIPPIQLSSKVFLRANSLDASRPSIILNCKSKAVRLGFSTHTAFLITSMTSSWALKAKESVIKLDEQAQVLPSQRTFEVNADVLAQMTNDQLQIIENAVQLAAKEDSPSHKEPKGTLLQAGVQIDHFAVELYDDIGTQLLMKEQLDANPAAFMNSSESKKMPALVPPRSAISNHPQFVLKTQPMSIDATVLNGGGMTVTAKLVNLEGFQNYLERPSTASAMEFNTQIIANSLTVLGGGTNLVIGVVIPPPPKEGEKLPMSVNIELQNLVELHLCTPLLLMMESGMDVVNMLLGVVDDFEAGGVAADESSPTPPDPLATPVISAPVVNAPKMSLSFKAAGLKAFVYNNYYYTSKEVKKLQDAVIAHDIEIARANAALFRKANKFAEDAKSMAVDNEVSFSHIRMHEDYVFATATVEGLGVNIRLHTVTMEIEGSLRSFTVGVTDPNLPPMYRTVIRPTSDSSSKDAMLMFSFIKKEREYPLIFETDPASKVPTKRVLKNAATFEATNCVQACIEPAQLVYDQPTIMSLLDWATSGFLSRLTAVASRPRYDGKFMIPPPPVPKKVMELNIEVKSPKALLPCHPRRGRVSLDKQLDDDDDNTYNGSNDHLEATLETVAIRSILSVEDLTQTIRIELTGFTVTEASRGKHVDPTSIGNTTAPIIPYLSINLFLVNGLDPMNTDPQRVLVRMLDTPLQLCTTPTQMTRVMTLFANNVLNLDPPAPPPIPKGLLEGRQDELRLVQGKKRDVVKLAGFEGFVQLPSPPVHVKGTVVDILIAAIELRCQNAQGVAQFDAVLSKLTTQLLLDQKIIGWSSLCIVDTRPKETLDSANSTELLVCDASTIVLKNCFEQHQEGATYSMVSDVCSWFVDEKCACWKSGGDAGFDDEKVKAWLPDAAALEGKPIDSASGKGTAISIIEIDFEIKRFALTAQWLHVFDYLLNEGNLAALAPMMGAKETTEVIPVKGASELRLTLTARRFVVPLLSNTSEVLFIANLDKLTVKFTSIDTGSVAAKLIHVSLGSVGLSHTSTGHKILYSTSATEASCETPLLDISLLIGNNATIIAVFMSELNAFVSMPVINQLIYYASDPSQPVSQISQLGVMKEERARLAALAAEQSKKGMLHLGLHWASPVLSVPCDARGDAAIVSKKSAQEEQSGTRVMTVRLGDLTTVVDLINTTTDLQPVTKTRQLDVLSLVVSEPASHLPTVAGQRSDTNVKVMLKNMNIESLLEDTSVSVKVNRTAWTPLPAAAARYLETHSSGQQLFAPPSTTALAIELSPTSLTASHQSLTDISNALFMNVALPTDIPDDVPPGDADASTEEIPLMPPAGSQSHIVFSNESLSAKLFDSNKKHFSSFYLRGIHASVGGLTEEETDCIDAYVTLMEAHEFSSGHKMLSTTSEKKAIQIQRQRCADSLIRTTVGVSGVYFVFVPKVLGSVIDLFLTPISEVSSSKKEQNAASETAVVEAPKTRSQLNVTMESLGIDLLQAGAGVDAQPVASLRIDSSHVRMEDGVNVPLSTVTGNSEDMSTVAVSELAVSVGRIEVQNKTTTLEAQSSGTKHNPLFETLVRQRSDCGSTSEFVSVKMMSLTDRKQRPETPAFFTFDSLLDVHVSSLEFILVPIVIAELASAVNEASQTITNASKVRNRASDAATNYMNEVSPSITRMRVSMDNPMISLAPTPFYQNTLNLTPGSFKIESSLSAPAVSNPGVQWSTISVLVTGMSTRLLGNEMLFHSKPIDVKYSSALKAPSFQSSAVEEPTPNKDNTVDDDLVLFDTKINVDVPDIAVTLTEEQMLFLFRGVFENNEVNAEIAQRIAKTTESSPQMSPQSAESNEISKDAPLAPPKTSKMTVSVGSIRLSALSLFEAQISSTQYIKAQVGPTTSYYTAAVEEIYVTHNLWPHLNLATRRQLRSLAESDLFSGSVLITSPTMAILSMRSVSANATMVTTDGQTLRDTRVSLGDSEVAVSPEVAKDIMKKVYEPMNAELFRAKVVPEPILLLRHTPSVALDGDLTLTNMRYLHVAGDDISTFELDLGGHTLSLSGIDPSAQIALAEDVLLTIKNGVINIPGLYSLDSFVHFGAGSKVIIDKTSVEINQRLWRLSGSHAPKAHTHSPGAPPNSVDDRVIDIMSGSFKIGVQMLSSHQALSRYLTSLRRSTHSALIDLDADTSKAVSSDAAKALVLTAQPKECVEVGLLARGRFKINLSINPATGKPVQQTIDVLVDSLQSFDGKLLRDTKAQVQMVGVGNIVLITSIDKIESLIAIDRLNKIVALANKLTSVISESFNPTLGKNEGGDEITEQNAAAKARWAELDIRQKNLGAIQTKDMHPSTFRVTPQMRDESTGLQYVTRPQAGVCRNCHEPGHATLSLSGMGDATIGTICPPCAFGKANVASFTGGECTIKKVGVLVVGYNGEMVEVSMASLSMNQKGEEIMVDASKAEGKPRKHKETTSESRTTISLSFESTVQIFNNGFTTWEPVLESLTFKMAGWKEDNVWHIMLPKKTETTLSRFALSTFTALGSQFGKTESTPVAEGVDTDEGSSPLMVTKNAQTNLRGVSANGSSDALERYEAELTDVRLVNYLADNLTVEEDRREDHVHPIQGRDTSIFPVEGSSCFVVHMERRLRIFLNQHAYFTMADLVVEVTTESYLDPQGAECKRCVVFVYPVHKSGSLIRIVSRVPCSMYNKSLGLLKADEQIYVDSSFPLVNPFLMEPRDVEGGPYSVIETVGTTVPSLRAILNGASPLVISKNMQSRSSVSLSFRIMAVSDGTICGAPRFSIIIDGGRKITNNVLIPVTVELLSGSLNIHKFTIPPLATRQIIFNSGSSSGIHYKFTCVQAMKNGADDDEQAKVLRNMSRGEVVVDEEEGRYTSSAVILSRGTQRLALQNLLQNVMTIQCTLNAMGSEMTLFTPFAIVNHTPLPLRLVEKTKGTQRMTNWEFLPAGMSLPMPVVPSEEQETPELMTKVQALGHYETRDFVPLHAVETAGQIELITAADNTSLQFSYYTTIAATGGMLITIVPRWVIVNRTPWSLHATQFTSASVSPIGMPPQTAHHCYKMQNLPKKSKESLQMCLLDPEQRMETGPYDGQSEAMPFSIEELSDFHVTLPGKHYNQVPDRQLKVSVFPEGARMFVTIEAVQSSSYLLVNRTNVPIAFSKPTCPHIPKQTIDKDTTLLSPQEVTRDVSAEPTGRIIAFAAPSEVRSFALNGNTVNTVLQSVVVTVGAVLEDGETTIRRGSPSFMIPIQNPDGGVPSPDRPIHLMGVITCRISQGSMGRTIVELTPYAALDTLNPSPTNREVNNQTQRILLPPRPTSLDVGLNITYLSVSLVEQPREILFGVFVDIRGRVQRTTEFEAYSFSVLNFQFDNQSERKPPYEGCFFAIRPNNDQTAIQGLLQRRVIPGRKVACFTTVRLDMVPIALRLSDGLLFNLREFAAGISASPKAEEVAREAIVLSHTYRNKENLYTSAPVAVGTDAMMVTIERMVINPIVVRLWFSRQRNDAKQDIIRSSQNAFLSYLVVSCEDVMIRIPGLTMQSQTAQMRGMLAKFKNFYLDGLKSQLFAVLFQYVSAIPLIGAPIKLVSDIGLGTFRVFQDRIDGLTESPEAFALAVASGTALVVGNVIGGSLNLVGMVAGSGAKLAGMATGDSDKKLNTATGFLKGFTGIVTKPMHGAAEGGAIGFFKGLGQGVVGVATNPLAGILGDLSKATTLVGSVFTDKYIPEVKRLRPIRLFLPGGAVARVETMVEVFQYQRKYAGDHFWTNNLLPTDGSNWKPKRRDEFEKEYRVSNEAWVLDRRKGTTFDGWTYGETITGSFNMHPEQTVHLRRRRWVIILRDQLVSDVVPKLPVVEISCPADDDTTALATPVSSIALSSSSSQVLSSNSSIKATTVGAMYCSTKSNEVETVRVVDIYENQRRYPLVGWSKKLMPTDRASWSDRQGRRMEPTETYPLEKGWEWVDEWHHVGGGVDGWEYAFDFPSKYTDKAAGTDCVRRRLWRRTMKRIE